MKLNLAALTSTELERLLGMDASRGVMSELSAAKLVGKAFPYVFNPLEEVQALSTPEETLQWSQELQDLGFTCHPLQLDTGFFRHLHQVPFSSELMVVTASWTPQGNAHLEAFSVLKDPVAGINAVVTTSAPHVFPLEFSEVISYKQVALPTPHFLEGHQQHVKQFGRPLKQNHAEDPLMVLRLVRDLCARAWLRRGVLLDESAPQARRGP
ncbi:hypothetical protein [Deinococcus cellulosilyticus]|uniref:Uncharacterized protein n=1 Tax=Deinococcus cellulosilyticus (strain DSM 18568 / NBRC 106333 / KACC 11606 / 5516J-15) TaxID=1223518 RepID=A0A511N3G1_DEIC1|nr:hypothetical protein DC3_30350 [Deinococcus cellulosilyticus NBRC 106333 = KACC 11606]